MIPRRRKSRSRPRPFRAELQALEPRALLAAPVAEWLGQDGRDLVGPYSAAVPDGIQDVHIQIRELDSARRVVAAKLLGLGGSAWVYHLPLGHWGAALEQDDGASVADLYVQPDRQETGRPFNLILTYSDDSESDLWFDGGTADPNLRMPDATLKAEWIGQRDDDFTGPSAAVGPDGFQDVAIALSGLPAQSEIAAIDVTGPVGSRWSYGLNSGGNLNAELQRSAADPTHATLYFSANQQLQDIDLKVEVVYATGQIDHALVRAGGVDLSRLTPPPTSTPVRRTDLTGVWLGQAAGTLAIDNARPGWLEMEVGGLLPERAILGATAEDGSGNTWTYLVNQNASALHLSSPYARPLVFVRDAADARRAWVAFPAIRASAADPISLRITYDDGSYALGEIASESIDLSRLASQPSASVFRAQPGDDLQSAVNQFGTVELAAGTYHLSQPLVLESAVRLVAPGGNATLLFEQPTSALPWTTAIKVHAGNTTLAGFSVRFAGPVRWDWGVSFGPALIGTTDSRDSSRPGLKTNLTFSNLDLQAPAALVDGEEAPRALRLVGADGGLIQGNRFQGGTIEFFGGPWNILDNQFLGTRAGSWAWDVFAGHSAVDLRLQGNVVSPLAGAGTTYRFLVLTGSGTDTVVSGNQVSGLGARDLAAAAVNAHEMILTEAYATHFEGKPISVSSDGRLLRIPPPQGDTPNAGDIVTVAAGTGAGRWARVAQVINATTLWLERALPAGVDAVAIGTGFVDTTIAQNRIDAQGTPSTSLVLLGTSVGTTVESNTILGGAGGIRATSYPTEKPVFWGWSHTPVFDLTIRGNDISDTQTGVILGVEHGSASKSSRGRVYQTVAVSQNRVWWTDGFAIDDKTQAVIVGDARALDPSETRLTLGPNFSTAARVGETFATIQVVSARVNETEVVDTRLALLPWGPSLPVLSLVNDTGASAADGITRDSHIAIDAPAGAIGLEYRIASARHWIGLDEAERFQPAGLAEGKNTVFARAIFPGGVLGDEASLEVVLDTQAPAPVSGIRSTTRGHVTFRVSDDARRYEYRVGDSPFRPVATPGSFDPEGLRFGANRLELRAIDAAGNVGLTRSTTVRWLPGSPSGLWIGQDNRDFTGPYRYAVADGTQDIHIQLGGLPAKALITFIDIQGKGGSRWQFNGNSGHWKIVVVRAAGATTADLFMQPDRVEVGREFEVKLSFGDGSRAHFYMMGGAANPALRMRATPASSKAPLAAHPEGLTKLTPGVARWLKAWKRRRAR